MTAQYRQSFVAALTAHFLLIVTAIGVSVLPAFWRPKPPEIFDVDLKQIDSFDKLSHKVPAPDHPAPPPPAPPMTTPDPAMPKDPVAPRTPADSKPKPPEPAKDKDGTIPDRTPNKPAASNAVAGATAVKIGLRTTRVVPGPHGPVRPLTPGELDPLNGIKAPLGNSNSVPMDERQQCLLRIKRALYDAWEQPAMTEAGRPPVLLESRFDASGRVIGAALAQSSGSDIMDRSALQAARSVARVEGLTPGFLREYSKVTIELKVTE